MLILIWNLQNSNSHFTDSRWVKQGLLPYMQVSTTLPTNMKFCFLDNNAFQTKVSKFLENNLPRKKSTNIWNELSLLQMNLTLHYYQVFVTLISNLYLSLFKVPRVDKMYKTTQRLLDFLELRDVQIQVPTPVLISKFIVLLNLPGTEYSKIVHTDESFTFSKECPQFI